MGQQSATQGSLSWYLPSHIKAWREANNEVANPLTELVAANHPEAMAEVESVDFGAFSEMFEEAQPAGRAQSEAQDIMADIMAAIASPTPEKSVNIESEQGDAIDKFLGLRDLRIVAKAEEAESSSEVWEQVEQSSLHSFEDDAASEELASIYLSQGLFEEAKAIYSRLFLLYSEKSVYFAGLIDKIDKKQLNN